MTNHVYTFSAGANYLAANPDVMKWAQQQARTAGIQPGKAFSDNLSKLAKQHYEQFGQGEGRNWGRASTVAKAAPPTTKNVAAQSKAVAAAPVGQPDGGQSAVRTDLLDRQPQPLLAPQPPKVQRDPIPAQFGAQDARFSSATPPAQSPGAATIDFSGADIYLRDNPDVMAWAQEQTRSAGGTPGTDAFGDRMRQFAEQHYLEFGKAEGRRWGAAGQATITAPPAGTETLNVGGVESQLTRPSVGWRYMPAPEPVAPAPAVTTGGDQPSPGSIQARLGGLLSQANPLMRAARTGALQAANRRGLLNSSLAAQAGEQAMLGAALPIAQAEAEIDLRLRLQRMSSESQEKIANLNVKAENQKGAMSAAAGMEQLYSSLLGSIMSNPNIPNDTRRQYEQHIANLRNSNLQLVEQIYGVDLDWNSVGMITPQVPV